MTPTLALASVAAALVSAAAAAPAPPKWLAPRDLSDKAADAIIPGVAVDPKGDTVVVWAQAKGSDWTVQSVYRPAGGTWSTPRPLSAAASHVASPQVAIAGGHVVAVWERYDGKNLIVQAAERDSRSGSWGIPTSLSRSGRDAQSPRVAVDARGDAVAVWASVGLMGWTVQAAVRPAGGKWQPPLDLDSPQPGTAAPDVVIDGSGTATAAWATTTGVGWRVNAASRPAGGSWTTPVALSELDAGGSLAPRLALEGTNDVTAVWSRTLGVASGFELATKNAVSGVWGPAGQLFPGLPGAIAPEIATDARGDGVIVWASPSRNGLALMASVRRPGKAWGPPGTLQGSGSSALAPEVALDAKGAALAVWVHSVGGVSRVQGSALPATGSVWSAARSLSRGDADALTPQVALDPDGDGAVTWVRYTGKSFVVQGNGYDATGPILGKLVLPTSGTVGRRIGFSVLPRDVWSAVTSIRWSFGDGTVGSGKLTSHVYERAGRYAVKVSASDSAGHVRSLRRFVTISRA